MLPPGVGVPVVEGQPIVEDQPVVGAGVGVGATEAAGRGVGALGVTLFARAAILRPRLTTLRLRAVLRAALFTVRRRVVFFARRALVLLRALFRDFLRFMASPAVGSKGSRRAKDLRGDAIECNGTGTRLGRLCDQP